MKVTVLDKGVKLVCNDPSKLVNRFVFCHKVIDPEVIALVMRCKFGNQAAKAMTNKVMEIDSIKYFGLVITFTTVSMIDYWSIGSITAWKAANG